MNDFDESIGFYEFVCLAALFEGGGVGVLSFPGCSLLLDWCFFVTWAVHSLFLLLCLVVVVVYCFLFLVSLFLFVACCLLLVVCCCLLFVVCCLLLCVLCCCLLE